MNTKVVLNLTLCLSAINLNFISLVYLHERIYIIQIDCGEIVACECRICINYGKALLFCIYLTGAMNLLRVKKRVRKQIKREKRNRKRKRERGEKQIFLLYIASKKLLKHILFLHRISHKIVQNENRGFILSHISRRYTYRYVI